MIESSLARTDRLTREQRAIVLHRERGEEIEHTGARTWAVPSCSGEGYYLVDLGAEDCDCPDFRRRRQNCKHIYAAAIERAKRSSCAGCSRKVRRRELVAVGPENLTFFEGDDLCRSCAWSHGEI